MINELAEKLRPGTICYYADAVSGEIQKAVVARVEAEHGKLVGFSVEFPDGNLFAKFPAAALSTVFTASEKDAQSIVRRSAVAM